MPPLPNPQVAITPYPSLEHPLFKQPHLVENLDYRYSRHEGDEDDDEPLELVSLLMFQRPRRAQRAPTRVGIRTSLRCRQLSCGVK